jgi:hypothetical protein
MSNNRQADVQDRLDRLYKLLKGLELAKDEAEAAEKARIQLKIDAQWGEIEPVEKEYAQRTAQQVKRHDLPEPEAEKIVAELVDELELIHSSDAHIQGMLQQILDELSKPGIPASGKLKIAIPIIPNIVSYEIEGDTESVVRRLFPTFVKIHENLKQLAADDKRKK